MSHQSDLIETDINAYLAQHEHKELLRFLTCGSVDDGKSTLIGRLLHDTKMIYEDQLEAIKSDSLKHGTTGAKVDLALLVDGLQAEREQGITIDVAYRYFSTAQRKFIIADTPGHEQYTRNMATGASTCDLAVILIDARYGVVTQTRRHAYIASLLGIKHIVVAINKMDLLGFSEDVFRRIQADFLAFAKSLNIPNIYVVPLSALEGDNVVHPSERCPWYTGATLMQILETVPIAGDKNYQDVRFPVQYVNRPHLDFRGFCGTLASGVVRVGQAVKALPSQKTSTIKAIVTFEGELPEAHAGQAITLTLADEIDISRGDVLVDAAADVVFGNALSAHVVWMAEQPFTLGRQYLFKFASKVTPGELAALHHRIDVNTQHTQAASQMQLNDIALVDIQLQQPVVIDAYSRNRATGAFIIIDRLTNVTVGAGMVEQAANAVQTTEAAGFSAFEQELNALIRKHFPHWQAKDISQLLK